MLTFVKSSVYSRHCFLWFTLTPHPLSKVRTIMHSISQIRNWGTNKLTNLPKLHVHYIKGLRFRPWQFCLVPRFLTTGIIDFHWIRLIQIEKIRVLGTSALLWSRLRWVIQIFYREEAFNHKDVHKHWTLRNAFTDFWHAKVLLIWQLYMFLSPFSESLSTKCLF